MAGSNCGERIELQLVCFDSRSKNITPLYTVFEN